MFLRITILLSCVAWLNILLDVYLHVFQMYSEYVWINLHVTCAVFDNVDSFVLVAKLGSEV